MSEVLGIGSAIVDQVLSVSEAYLEKLPGEKWGSEVVKPEELFHIIEESGSVPTRVVGGSAANAIKGLASLGHPCSFFSKIGKDPEGEMVRSAFQKFGIQPQFVPIDYPTGQVACLVTPDGKRTMRWFMGASVHLQPDDLDPSLFHNVKLVHIEGYNLYNDGVVQKAMKLAREAGAAISFDLSSFEIVDEYREALLELLPRYVDILFANADEAAALTHLAPRHACSELARLCRTVVVMDGAKGGFIGSSKGVEPYQALEVTPVDTTGAGDLFASGFLHGWLLKKSLSVCAHYGAVLGREVVQRFGAEIPPDSWEEVKKCIL